MKKITTIITAIAIGIFFSIVGYGQTDPVSIGRTEYGEAGSGIWVNSLFVEAQNLYGQEKIYDAAAKFIESANYEAASENISWQCWTLSLHMAGSIYYSGEYWEYAINSWKLLLDHHYQTQAWENYVRLGQSLGACYMYNKQYQESVETFTNLWKLFERDTNKDAPMGLTNRAAMLKSIGVAYEEWTKYDSAYNYYQKSLELNKRANNTEETAKLQEYVDRVSKKL
jgi:tetratricopeptide (TPR) repeat protein